MIANKYNILRTGEEYKFRVFPIDPYDAFRGRYVSLNTNTGQEIYGNGKYGLIAVDEDGFARIASTTNEKPVSDPYVKSISRSWFVLPITRYYMEEKLAPRAELLAWQRGPGEEAYVTVRVKNGDLIISGLYIDGEAIEDILRR